MGERLIAILAVSLLLASAGAAFGEGENFRKMSVPAVTAEVKGVLTEIEVELVPGKGRILFNAEPFAGIQTQNSERVAQAVAQNFTGKNLSDKDIIITFRAPAVSIDGPSAGAAMAILLISAIENKPIRNDASITGTIQPDGTIGPVGGVFAKAEAAHNASFKYFLIPRSQEIVEQNVDETFSPMPGANLTRTIVRTRNVTRYAEQNWNMTVIPVGDIADAYEVFVKGKNATPARRISAQVVELESADVPPSIQPFANIVKARLANSSNSLTEAKAEYKKSTIDSRILADIADLIDQSESEYKKAGTAFDKNYMYGAANHAFRSKVYSKTASDVMRFYSIKADSNKKQFLQNRKADVERLLNATQMKFSDAQLYSNDTGSYEWAAAGHSRLAQAEEQFATLTPTEAALYELSLVEGWSEIASGLYDIAKQSKNWAIFDASAFKADSEAKIIDLDKILSSYTVEPPQGASWLSRAAQREYSHGWFVAAFIDSEIANKRIEAERELSIRTFENYTDLVAQKINSVSEGTSPWAKLYKDQARLILYYAKRDQDRSALNVALAFANEAKIYTDLDKRIEALPKVKQKIEQRINVKFTLFGIMLLGLGLIVAYYTLARMKDLGPRKWHLH